MTIEDLGLKLLEQFPVALFVVYVGRYAVGQIKEIGEKCHQAHEKLLESCHDTHAEMVQKQERRAEALETLVAETNRVLGEAGVHLKRCADTMLAEDGA